MISLGPTGRRQPDSAGASLRVGLFGNLGSGNLGNDGSVDAVLGYLRTWHPDATLGVMCAGPDRVTKLYGIPAVHLQWSQKRDRRASGVLKAIGKAVDAFRTAAWVRRFDVVIVPGMGVLEASVPLSPWAFPYSLFLLSTTARLSGTRVALVSVGAEVIGRRPTRWLITRAAKLAHYRSYRDAFSKESMSRMDVDCQDDAVYADLAFALPTPAEAPDNGRTVGVGVMAYQGSDDDWGRADEIRAAYLGNLKRFVRWLVVGGRSVRLFVGDRIDEDVVNEIIADARAHQPGLDGSRVVAATASSLEDLMRQMSGVDAVVATRYHNVLCALKLGKPTLSIGYASKHDVLMEAMGVGEFCQQARSVDFDRLVEQFTELEARAREVQKTLAQRNAAAARRLDEQWAALSAALLPATERVRGGAR